MTGVDGSGNSASITASVGTITKDDQAGTWSWSYPVADGPQSQEVIISIENDCGVVEDLIFDVVVKTFKTRQQKDATG